MMLCPLTALQCNNKLFQQRYLGSEGGTSALATRMKRKKLYESFPTIDTTLLDQIFEANWYAQLC